MKLKIASLLLLCISQSIFAAIVSGAEYRTIQSFLYGRFEVRMKSAQGSGIISSFFTYSDQSYGAGNWNEIDVELLGRYSDRVQLNYITGTPGLEVHHIQNCFNFGNTNQEFHTYAFEWYPDLIVWYVDGKKVHEASDHVKAYMTNAQRIMVNIWASSDVAWVGDFNKFILPKYAYYDYVAYYSYTPKTGLNGSDFTFQWRDNFNNWDQTRWTKSTHSWDANYAQFNTKNVVFADSTAILDLTLMGAEGSIPTAVKKDKFLENKIKHMITTDKNGLTIYSSVIGGGGIVSLYTTSGKLIKTVHIENLNNKVHLRWSEMDIRSNSIVYICKNQNRAITGILNLYSIK